jgi:hypothetical protein
MTLSQRDAISRLAALSAMTALPRSPWSFADGEPDPLDGTIVQYLDGFHRGRCSAAEVTAEALERCRTDGLALGAIDALSATALDEARAADSRRRAGTLRGPLDGVPVFAKSIYDMNGLQGALVPAVVGRGQDDSCRRRGIRTLPARRMMDGGSSLTGTCSRQAGAGRRPTWEPASGRPNNGSVRL